MTTTTATVEAKPVTSRPKADPKDRKVLAKGSSIARNLGELSRDNARTFAASGKVVFGGLTTLGKANVAEAEAAFTQLSTSLKGLAAVQSPVEFYKLQGELLQNSFQAAIAFNTRNRETLIKLAEEAAAPLKQQAKKVAGVLGKSA